MYARMNPGQGLSGFLEDLQRTTLRMWCSIPNAVGITGTRGSICRTVLEQQDIERGDYRPPPVPGSPAGPAIPSAQQPGGACLSGESAGDCVLRIRGELEKAAAIAAATEEARRLAWSADQDERNRMTACIERGGDWNRETRSCSEDSQISGLTWVALAIGGALLVSTVRGR